MTTRLLSLALQLLLAMSPLLAALPAWCSTDAFTPDAHLRADEVRAKEERLRAFLAAEKLDGVLLGTQRNFAWLTAGGDSHVVFNAEEGSALLLWTPRKKFAVIANNEVERLTHEELAGLGYEPVVYRWDKDLSAGARAKVLARLTDGLRIGCDLPLSGTIDVAGKFAALRAPLTPGELERYRWLARTTAEIVETAARSVSPGDTEERIQGRVGGELFRRNILPTVLLVAADDRIGHFKHAITQDTPVRREAMITVCARKWGLVVAVTRHVHFGPLPPALAERQAAAGRIFAAMLAATRSGATAGDVIAAAERAYADAGYPDEWSSHHLGGAIGYREREYKAFPGMAQLLREHEAFAWNPTLPGVKAEDTVLLRDGKLETLTDTGGHWPRARVELAGRVFFVPEILVK